MGTSQEKSGSYSHLPQESLEVDHGYSNKYNGAAGLEVVPPNAPEAYNRPAPDEKILYTQGKPQREQRRVCGVTPLIFWIMIFTIVLILAAGLGGGLGAGLSHKSSAKTDADNNSASRLVLVFPSARGCPKATRHGIYISISNKCLTF